MNYLLIGQEEYLKNKFLEKLKKTVPDKNNGQKPDFDAYTAGESDIGNILDSIYTLPFASKHKIILIRDVEGFSADERKAVLKYLKSPRETTTLALTSSSDGLNKFLQEISRFAKLISCPRLKNRELSVWIIKEFAARRKKISAPLASLMADIAGKDLFLLENEIEKMCAFLKDLEIVEEEHVEALMGKLSYKTGFELIQAVVDKKIEKILASLESLLIKEKPHRILSLLAWQFRTFIKIKNLPEKLSADKISLALGMNPRFAEKAVRAARRFDSSGLERNLATLLRADLSIKRGKMNERDALECALIELCR